MIEERAKRKLSGILSADAVGYSRLMHEDEASTIRNLEDCKKLMSELIEQYNGRVVDAPGDNLLAEFGSVVDATECSVKIQKELKAKNAELPDNRKMEFRIGVNLGDVVEEADRIYGDGVNIAARIEGLAEPGGICISRTAFDHVKNKLKIGYEYLGEHSVKNIAEPVRVYRILMEPEAAGRVIGEKKLKSMTWRWAASGAIVLTIIVAGIFAIWNYYFRPSFEPASVEKMAFPIPDKPSIAVLPFDNMSGDPEQDYIADGLTENIITGLSQISEMFVIARNSVFTFKGKPVKIKQVSEELGVEYVLEGSVQKSGDSLRVNAQLVDALKGHHLWSEKYDRKMENFFSIQDDITLNIVIALEVKLTEGEQARVRHSTDNLKAWALAQKAKGLFETYARENNAKARELFTKAVELDPDYAYAWSYLGWTYWIDGVYHSAHYDRKKSFESASKMAEKALSTDDKSSDAHALLSAVNLSQQKYDEAVAAGEKTIDLDPNSSENHAIVAITMQNVGKFEEAIALLGQAMRLDPYYPHWYLARLGLCYQMVGRYEDSAAAFEELIKRYRESQTAAPWDRAYLMLAATYSMMGRLEEARDLVSKALEFNPKMTVDLWRKRFQYKNPEHTQRILDALRKVGLPEHPPLPFPDKPSIAVLPFVNMSGDSEQEYFSDGMTEEIITALSKTPKLFVIARTSSFKYKGKEVDVRMVGRELGVRYVLEGSVRKFGDKVRITAQLIDAKTNHHLWAERYDREMKDTFALQDEITMKMLTALEVNLSEGEQAVMMVKGTRNLEAYLKVLQSTFYRRRLNVEDNVKARRLAEEAISLDPNYAIAYTSLGRTHIVDVWLRSTISLQESTGMAINLAEKALSLDDSLADAYDIIGNSLILRRDYEKAIAKLERALKLEPNGADIHGHLGMALVFDDRPQEAVQLFQKAIRLNPTPPSWYLHMLATAYKFIEKYDEAIFWGEKAVRQNPKSLIGHVVLCSIYSSADRMEEARKEASEILKINPKYSVSQAEKTNPLKNQAVKKRYFDALRKAGLPD